MPAKSRSRIAPSELLIVSLVVGTLALMLFPVFARARDRARQAACFGNMRSIVRAVLMYAADHDGFLPPEEHDPEAVAYFDTGPGGGAKVHWPRNHPHCGRASDANPYLRWPVILESYLPGRDVWRCPSARLEGGAAFINGGGAGWLAHLQKHQGEWGPDSDPWLCPIPSWPRGWGGAVTDSLTEQRLAVPHGGKGRVASPGMFLQSITCNTHAADRNVAFIEDPAWFVIAADSGASTENFGTGTLAYPDLCGLECAGPGGWRPDHENCPWSRQCGATVEMKLDPQKRQKHARHFGGVNLGFLDGHVRWFHSEKVIELSPSHGDPNRGRLRGYDAWGPTRDAPWYDPAEGVPALY